MVHGTNYGVQYIIKLNKDIDLYDDLLPICSHVRTMLKILPDKKICILPYTLLDKRFYEKEESKKLISSLFSEREDKNIYLDVLYYSINIKGKKNLIPTSREEILQLELIKNKLLDSETYSKEINNEIIRLTKILKIQHIISDNEYYQKIIELERKITNIELTNEEKTIIHKVISHPKLEGLLEYSDFELMSEDY